MIFGRLLGRIFVTGKVIRKIKRTTIASKEITEQKNPFIGKKVIFVAGENDKMNADGKRGYLIAVLDIDYHPVFYEKHVKRAIDVVLSLGE